MSGDNWQPSAEAMQAAISRRQRMERLHDAAPDLLDAARNAVAWCCGEKGEKSIGGEFCSACAPLNAAISKAEGVQST